MKHGLKDIFAEGTDFAEKTAADIVAQAEKIKGKRIADEDRTAGLTRLSDLTDPGGVVSDIVDWIVSSSSRPSRELALSATIPFVGALIGSRFASATDLRTNFYTVALAGSGYGKDHARTQLKRLEGGIDKDQPCPFALFSKDAVRQLPSAQPRQEITLRPLCRRLNCDFRHREHQPTHLHLRTIGGGNGLSPKTIRRS